MLPIPKPPTLKKTTEPAPPTTRSPSSVRAFAAAEVEPQALAFNRSEEFNEVLFARLGQLGLLGISADPEHGGAGMDARAVVIAHEELAAVDPAFTLSYLVQNTNYNICAALRALRPPQDHPVKKSRPLRCAHAASASQRDDPASATAHSAACVLIL